MKPLIIKTRINDTLQNQHLLDETFPANDLDTLATNFTSIKGHKSEFQKLIRQYVKIHKEKKEGIRAATARLYREAFYSVPKRTRIEYGATDADATGRLRKLYRPFLKQSSLVPLNRLMSECIKMYVEIECNGMYIDIQEIGRLDILYKKNIKSLVRKLDKLSKGLVANHNSPLQVKNLLYGHWKLPGFPVRQGKKVVRFTTAKDAIHQILQTQIKNRIRKYLVNYQEYKRITKLHGTYIKGMGRFLRSGNLIHANWNLTGAETGRNSCSNPNLQNIPRKGDIKRIFISRFSNGVLMQIDASQGELRMAAHISQEPTMVRLFNMGDIDIHRMMAAELLKITEKKVTEDERYMTKQCNFALPFGTGVDTLHQEMRKEKPNISRAVAEMFKDKWFDTFSGWEKFVEETKRLLLKYGYVQNPYGRRRHLNLFMNVNTPEAQSLIRKGVNAPIQGGLADYNRRYGVRVWKEVHKRGWQDKLLLNGEVHDAWMWDCYNLDWAKRLAPIIRKEAEDRDITEFGFRFRVPMKVDIKVGKNWAEMEELV